MTPKNLAPSPNQHAPNTAKIVTSRESRRTNKIGIVTTPHARVQSKLTSAVGDFHPQFFCEDDPVHRIAYSESTIAVRNQGVSE